MKNWLAGFADILLPDPAGRRAIDETLQDYRDERVRASTLPQRITTDVRYVAAIGRVIVSTGVRDLASLDTWRVLAWCVAMCVVAMPYQMVLLGGFARVISESSFKNRT